MKKVPKLSLFLFASAIIVVTSLIFTACNKDSSQPNLQTAPFTSPEQSVLEVDLKSLVTFEDGALTFKDCEDLKKVYMYLGNPSTPVDILSKTFPGFVSLSDAYEQISKIASEREVQPEEFKNVAYWLGTGDEMSFERSIENPIYARIFNQEGLIKLDDAWVKHTNTGISFYSSQHTSIGSTTEPLYNVGLPAKDRSHDCETVYAFQNGNQWKKVTGTQGANYYLSCANGICQIILLGNFAIESKSRKRGFLGRWFAYNADVVGINGLGSNTNASSYTGIGAGGNTTFVTDNGVTGTCDPF